MEQIADVLKKFDRLGDVRDALSKVSDRPPPTLQAISSWGTTGRIPSWWQVPFVAAAKQAGIKGVTLELVARLSSEENTTPRSARR